MMAQAKNNAVSLAVKLLARRDHSERELRDKLAQRGYMREDIESALARLRERGYLDDRAFCCKLALTLWESGKYGIGGICSQLRKRGLAEAIVKEVVAEFEYSQELSRAVVLLESRGLDADKREKAGRFLASRGFSFSTIQRALEQSGC